MTKKCLKCKYLDGRREHVKFCGYILKVGVPRGCPADEKCDKFEPRYEVKGGAE